MLLFLSSVPCAKSCYWEVFAQGQWHETAQFFPLPHQSEILCFEAKVPNHPTSYAALLPALLIAKFFLLNKKKNKNKKPFSLCLVALLHSCCCILFVIGSLGCKSALFQLLRSGSALRACPFSVHKQGFSNSTDHKAVNKANHKFSIRQVPLLGATPSTPRH